MVSYANVPQFRKHPLVSSVALYRYVVDDTIEIGIDKLFNGAQDGISSKVPMLWTGLVV
jgi:hypothetical protein